MVEQVLINLIRNAIQSFEDQADKQVEIKAYVNEKSRAVISIKDNGTGIDPEAMEKIFIPFFTTKKTAQVLDLVSPVRLCDNIREP